MKKIIFAILSIMLISTSAYAVEVKLTCNPNTESDLAGYRIYQSNNSGQFDPTTQKVADVSMGPNVSPLFTVNVALNDGRTIYFVATAYDTSGNESDYSNEVSYKVPDGIPPNPPNMLNIMQQIANALTNIANNGLTLKIAD